ncbi:MAG: replicative DNA helicase [Lachnospiraceae bacterium]|nr:replicative DNA helicase [Lachnospiraceae bacterium]
MEENVIKRLMPNSHDAEMSVIGAMIMDRDAITHAADRLSPDDFYTQEFKVMFEAIKEMYTVGQAVDITTLIVKLQEKDLAPEFCGLEHIMSIVDRTPTSANIKYYVDIVQDKAIERRLIKTLEGLAGEAYMEKEGVQSLLDHTEKEVFKLVQSRGSSDHVDIKQVVYSTLRNIEAAAKNSSGITGVATGFRDLDRSLAGLQKSDFILIAARPSMGKTAFVLNLANYIAVRSKVTTVFFSLEMSRESLVERMLAMDSLISATTLRAGTLKDNEWGDLVGAAREIGDSALIIEDTPGISVAELRSKCRKYKLENNLGLIIIDYLQLMSGDGRTESRQQEVSEISRSLKALARELDVPLIALSQLSRAVESRPDKRPMMSDLRESGSIEQDADVVMFIYRDEYYNKNTEHPGEAEIIISKQRKGPTGTVRLQWQAQYTRFRNLEHEHQDNE